MLLVSTLTTLCLSVGTKGFLLFFFFLKVLLFYILMGVGDSFWVNLSIMYEVRLRGKFLPVNVLPLLNCLCIFVKKTHSWAYFCESIFGSIVLFHQSMCLTITPKPHCLDYYDNNTELSDSSHSNLPHQGCFNYPGVCDFPYKF